MALTVPFTFTAGTDILSAQVNSNFAQVLNGLDKRGDTLTGNLIVSSSITIDGVDISAVIGAGGTLLAVNGAAVTALNASNLASGTAAVARLGSGSPSSANYLRGDGAWTAMSASGKTVDGRLTLTSGTPVTTADVTGATNIYFTPYRGNEIALYDGSAGWNIRTFAEITIALGTLVDDKPYDLFAYDNSGTVTFDAPLVWTNDTTRATALTLQDGVLVKNGATTRRYIGTFYTTATTTTEDSNKNRLLWNYYNRQQRPVYHNASGSHTYQTATWRQYDGDAANQIELVQGWPEDVFAMSVLSHVYGSVVGSFAATGLQVDFTNGVNTLGTIPEPQFSLATTQATIQGFLTTNCGVGKHNITWVQRSLASGTITWFATGAVGVERGGITGFCWA